MTGLTAWAASVATLIAAWPLTLTGIRAEWWEQASRDIAEAREWLGC